MADAPEFISSEDQPTMEEFGFTPNAVEPRQVDFTVVAVAFGVGVLVFVTALYLICKVCCLACKFLNPPEDQKPTAETASKTNKKTDEVEETDEATGKKIKLLKPAKSL